MKNFSKFRRAAVAHSNDYADRHRTERRSKGKLLWVKMIGRACHNPAFAAKVTVVG